MKFVFLFMIAVSSFIATAKTERCQTARQGMVMAEQQKDIHQKLDILLLAAKQCPAPDTYLALANSYLNNSQANDALQWLVKAEPFIAVENTLLVGILNALKTEAYVQQNRLCKAYSTLLTAKKWLGQEDPLFKEVDLAFEYQRSQQALNEASLHCLLGVTRSAFDRGIGIRPGIKVGINISVAFATDSDIPTELGSVQVTQLANALSNADYQAYRFVIVGHADIRGDANYNLRLSQKRAAKVMRQIIQQSPMLTARLTYQGEGETKPKAQGNSARSHAINRRVEVLLYQ